MLSREKIQYFIVGGRFLRSVYLAERPARSKSHRIVGLFYGSLEKKGTFAHLTAAATHNQVLIRLQRPLRAHDKFCWCYWAEIETRISSLVVSQGYGGWYSMEWNKNFFCCIFLSVEVSTGNIGSPAPKRGKFDSNSVIEPLLRLNLQRFPFIWVSLCVFFLRWNLQHFYFVAVSRTCISCVWILSTYFLLQSPFNLFFMRFNHQHFPVVEASLWLAFPAFESPAFSSRWSLPLTGTSRVWISSTFLSLQSSFDGYFLCLILQHFPVVEVSLWLVFPAFESPLPFSWFSFP